MTSDSNPALRKIIHVDMDAFYAAIEQRDAPELRGRPVVVGGSPDGRGVVATCSYEARRFGIHSAMPAARAIRLCPQAVFIRPRFDVYRDVSRQIQALFLEYTPLVEPLSLDEAFLDVSGTAAFQGSATLIARDIRQRITETTGLTASAGVSYNKFLAKQASDLDKPDGLTLIRPEQGMDFVARLPVGKFHGVGRATEARLHELGIHTGADFLRWSAAELQQLLGRRAAFFQDIAQGHDERPVQPRRLRKSVGAETTFSEDLARPAEMLDALQSLAEKVAHRLAEKRLQGATLTLKVKYADFRQITRSHSRLQSFREAADMLAIASTLLQRTEAPRRPVRLLGLAVAGLEPADRPLAAQMNFGDW